ncbi:NADP-dependent oxidoreductase [Kineococcus indalonis]|uniref:NADP-dependent oxidoreductase n=1 Tax=Kineococcus indalonis TaxID=2696566 RepID=UPI001412D8B0|nr:NADP-dependent oxidoreductase [Kineococcus indalonis]NAZ87117.1 zinc-binding dehydrogenase [Kineococcus indalonis]
MTRVVRFERFGGPDVLHVVDEPAADPGPGQVRVTVRAAGITTGESAAREGALAELYPGAFPGSEGAEFAGVVTAVGPGGAFEVGEEVLGWSERRAAHAEAVVVPGTHLVRKPADLPWEVAGSLYVAGVAAHACVCAVGVRDGDAVVVDGATTDVGSFAVQLARLCGARVVGVAAVEHHDWLHAHGCDAVAPAADPAVLARRVRELTPRVDALVDTTGADLPPLTGALDVAPERAVSTVEVEAAVEFGGAPAPTATRRAEVLAELAQLVAGGRLHVPIAGAYPLADVRAAAAAAERPGRHGRVVLLP